MAKLISAKCPSCGANLPFMPGAHQVTCRFCQNVITVQVQQPPPNVTPFGMPGGIPSRTLYVDPAAFKAAQQAGKMSAIVFLVIFAVPFVIGIAAAVGPCVMHKIRPFPISCGVNQEVEVSGDWESTGPVVTRADTNCKIKIKNAKIKAPTFLESGAYNVEVTLDNVQIETTGPMIKGVSNLKLRVKNSTLVSTADVMSLGTNSEITIDDSTVESKGGVAIKGASNLKVHAHGAKIRGKKGALDVKTNLQAELLKACEVTSSDGVALAAESSAKLEIDGGKIEGAGGAIETSSSLDLTAASVAISSAKEKAIATKSSSKISLTDATVTSGAEVALDVDSNAEITLAGATVQGTVGVVGTSSLKLKATKKSRVIGTTGAAFFGTSNMDIALTESSLEGATKGLRGTSSVKVKLGQGARVAGKQGGIEAESSFTLDATGATIEGGGGPAILTSSGASIAVRQGVLKGNPALQSSYAVSPDLTGTRVEGGQVVKR